MNLQQMEYIVALDKYRHFVLAAEACGVTQPTLSAMIQKLEEELDVKIFSRDRKNIAPTAIGEKIIRQAQIALNESQRIKELVSDETGTMKGSLRIGILPTIAPYLVPDFIHHFREAHPDVDLFIDEKENASLVRELRFGNIDIAISTLPEDREGILEIPVYIEKFVAYFSSACSQAQKIIASGSLPAEHMSLWQDLCLQHSFEIKHLAIEGGSNRFESVRNALETIKDSKGLVAIHDGARPLVTKELIQKGFETAEMCGTAIPAVPVTDSIRQLDRQGSHTVNRESFVAVQTPQIFNLEILQKAYTADYSPMFTDDASVVEFNGQSVTLYDGSSENIKITRPIDLKIAETILIDRK